MGEWASADLMGAAVTAPVASSPARKVWGDQAGFVEYFEDSESAGHRHAPPGHVPGPRVTAEA